MNCSFYLKGRLTEQGGGGTSIRWPWYTRQDKRQDADERYTLHLTSRRKWNSKGTSRVKSTQETLADVIPICRD
ncbi:MAG TPA: hypothetical protein VHJ59_02180, partial [Nitrososphaera sp.]|nr:hypothetical protein [Nitrososphaera sp.]